MATNNDYYRGYVAGYIRFGDIPYKYLDDDIKNYAMRKEPFIYYERMLEYTLQGVNKIKVSKFVASVPERYKTYKFYKKIIEFDANKYESLVPLKFRDMIKIKTLDTSDLIANFKCIPASERTPLMYRKLSKLSFRDYLMYVINYTGVPDIYRTKQMCIELFLGNIDEYLKQIPDEYKSVELGELLVKKDFKKYFPILPEHCRTKEMYEAYVKLDPAGNIDKVPKEKRTQKMYEMLFDYTLDTYLDKIPKAYITREMYHRLVRIDVNKYLHLVPTMYLDDEIARYLVDNNLKYLELLPDSVLSKSFFMGLIKKNPQKYLKVLPDRYYTNEVVEEIVRILRGKNIEYAINGGRQLNKLILDKYPFLINQFTVSAIHDIIEYELVKMVDKGTDIKSIMEKYYISSEVIAHTLSVIKKHNLGLYTHINNYLNSDQIYQKKVNIDDNLRTLENIINSLGQVSRIKITVNQKLQFAYLSKRYLEYSIEDIYAYNVSNRNSKVSNTVSSFVEYVLNYSLYANKYTGLISIKPITFNNEWLKDFDYVKFFGIKNNEAKTKHFYGPKQMELTMEVAGQILDRLKREEIPLNSLIVNVAFRRYFMDELDDYIKELHSFDELLNKPKRKKR